MNSHGYATLRVCDLATAELFSLWAIRSWVADYQAPTSTRERLAKGFELAGVPNGLAALDEMLSVFAVSSRVQIDIRCLHCRSLGAGEIAMLTMIGAAQIGRLDDARDGLAHWLPPASVRMATDAARRFAAALWAGGLILPRRGQPAVVLPHTPVSHCPDRGIRLRQ